MDIKASVENLNIIFKPMKSNPLVYFLKEGDGVYIKTIDPWHVELMKISIPMDVSNISLSNVPDGKFIYAIPLKHLLNPLSYFPDNQNVILSFEQDKLSMKVDNSYTRNINYHSVQDIVNDPVLSDIAIQKIHVNATDLIKGVNLTKDLTDRITFRLNKTDFSIMSESVETGIRSVYQIEDVELSHITRTVASSFDPTYLLDILPFIKGDVLIFLGNDYPIQLMGTLKNELPFKAFIAPRIDTPKKETNS
ncbi:MAG: hypothetical protein QXU98_01725 [Candidatus Parvarchaeota archaeon]